MSKKQKWHIKSDFSFGKQSWAPRIHSSHSSVFSTFGKLWVIVLTCMLAPLQAVVAKRCKPENMTWAAFWPLFSIVDMSPWQPSKSTMFQPFDFWSISMQVHSNYTYAESLSIVYNWDCLTLMYNSTLDKTLLT